MENKRRVLVVDGDPLALAAFRQIYEQAGLAPVSASSGAAAIAQSAQALPDLCLVDVYLPDTSGLALIGQLRRRPELARAAIIGMSGRRDDQVLRAAFAAGADDFVFRPVLADELMVRSMLAIDRRRGHTSGEGVGSRRRELTALFCDVRGFTGIAATMDPEWVVEVLNGLFEELVAHVHAWGGQVDKYLGDGLLAFFGLEEAADAKELRAIKAALAMVDSAAHYGRDSLVLDGRPLRVGAGIATGQVVIAPLGARTLRQVTAIGDSVNLASRLEGIAGEGEVLICPQSFSRVAGLVETGAPRVVVLKGVAGTPTVHCVIGVRPESFLG